MMFYVISCWRFSRFHVNALDLFVAAVHLLSWSLEESVVGVSGGFSLFRLMASSSAKRISQLNADRDLTRAIAAYLKDRRARLESQLCQRAGMDKNTRRLELRRLARIAFHQEPQSVKTSYLEAILESRSENQAAAESAEPDAKRRRLMGKQTLPVRLGPLSSDASSSKATAGQQAEQEQPKTPLRRTVAVTTLCLPAAPSAPATSPEKNVGESGSDRVGTSTSASPGKQSVRESGCVADRSMLSAVISASAGPSKQKLGPPSLLMSSLPPCLPRLTRAIGQANAAEVLGSATRILQNCPEVLGETLPLRLRQAVLFGAAAKLKADANTMNIADVWGQFVKCDDARTRQQIIALEMHLVMALGRA